MRAKNTVQLGRLLLWVLLICHWTACLWHGLFEALSGERRSMPGAAWKGSCCCACRVFVGAARLRPRHGARMGWRHVLDPSWRLAAAAQSEELQGSRDGLAACEHGAQAREPHGRVLRVR
jgi:hypothetical protein